MNQTAQIYGGYVYGAYGHYLVHDPLSGWTRRYERAQMDSGKQLIDVVRRCNADLARICLEPLNREQLECLSDPARCDEALEMIDDLEYRVGISAGVRGELGAFITDNAIAYGADLGQ